MIRCVLVCAIGAACSSKSAPVADDCEIVVRDPAHAAVEITKRYPHDPVTVAHVIEHCIAPTGDDCERFAAILKAIPSMMAAPPPHASGGNYVELCRGMPPEMRRCMLPSYALAHAAECADMRTKMATAAIDEVSIAPSTVPACDPGTLAVLITAEGLWLGTGTGARGRYFAARKDRALDLAWLERQLRDRASADCRPGVEIAAEQDIAYQEIVAVMDTSLRAGLADIGLTSPDALAVSFAGAHPTTAPDACSGDGVRPASASSPARQPAVASDSRATLASAPVVIVTKTEVTLRIDKSDTSLGSPLDLAAAAGKLDALARGLPARKSGGMLILQTDQSAPAGLIDRIVSTAKAAGYDNVLFAVKTK